MSQENSDMSTKFSTLNVNAVEFVPSFGFSSVRGPTTTPNDAGVTPMEVNDVNSAQATPKSSTATTPDSAAVSEASNNTNATNPTSTAINNNNVENAAPTEPQTDTAAVVSPVPSQDSSMDTSPTTALKTAENDIEIDAPKELTVGDLLAIPGKNPTLCYQCIIVK